MQVSTSIQTRTHEPIPTISSEQSQLSAFTMIIIIVGRSVYDPPCFCFIGIRWSCGCRGQRNCLPALKAQAILIRSTLRFPIMRCAVGICRCIKNSSGSRDRPSYGFYFLSERRNKDSMLLLLLLLLQDENTEFVMVFK